MKKKVKKIPKCALGTEFVDKWGKMSASERGGAIAGAISATAPGVASAIGIEQGKNSQIANAIATGLDAIPIFGKIGGDIVRTFGAFAGEGGHVDQNTGEYTKASGLTKVFGFGRSDDSIMREANRIKGSILAKARTEDLQADWMNQGINPAPNVLAAEGGTVPGEHYASRGEVEVAADGTNAVRYGWDPKGKDTYHVYTNPDGSSAVGNMVFTEEGVKRPNGEKYSDAAEKIIKGTKEGSKLRQISLRKLANEMEELKMGKEIKKLKRGIPAHEGGKTGKEELAAEMAARKRLALDITKMAIIELPDGTRVLQDLYGNQYNFEDFGILDMGDQPTVYTGVAPSAGKWNGSMNFAKQMLNSKNVAKLRNTMTKVLPKGAKQTTVSTAGKGAKAVQAEKEMLNNDRTSQMWQRMGNKGGVPQKTLEGPQTWATARGSSNLWENPMVLLSGDDIASAISTAYYLNKGLPTAIGVSAMLGGAGTFLTYEALKDNWGKDAPVQTTIPMQAKDNLSEETKTTTTASTIPATNEKKNEITVSKPSSGKKTTTARVTTPTTSQEEKATPEQFAENLKSVQNNDIGERHWLRGPIETKSLAKVAFENAPKPIAPPFTVLKPEQDADVNYSNPSWQDWLYRTALLTQPLWDRAKAEPIQYEIPNAKYVPTGVDVSGQLRDVSEGYALSRYNFANLYPNTGAGMAAGLQAASTAAKQRADIHQYKTDAQNKLIGANVGIYNNWANRRAEILNDMYNKAAANRASARNINRQNRAAALSNYGQMLRDDKQYAIDTLKLDALTPLIMYGTENSDTLIKKARQILNK